MLSDKINQTMHEIKITQNRLDQLHHQGGLMNLKYDEMDEKEKNPIGNKV